MPTARVGVVGAGYVGLVTGVCLASLGHEVVIRDINESKVERLRAGEVPIYEPGLDELIADCRDRLTFTTDLQEMVTGADVAFIAVDTPPLPSGDADLSRVMGFVNELGALPADLVGDLVLVTKSTVPVGTGRRVRDTLDQLGLTAVGYASNPEFLKEGDAIADFMNPDRVVVGAWRGEDADRVADLYASLQAPVLRTSVATAEMVKYASNAFLATKISFINEIANVCEEVGADVAVVSQGMGMDHRIGQAFLRAGIGFGGSCFPKDVAALKQLAGNSGYHFQLLTSVIEVNELQKRRVVGKLRNRLGDVRGKRVALLGLAFKPGTDDMREAASLVLAGRLLAEGAQVVGWDPVVTEMPGVSGMEIADSIPNAVAGADAVVIVTEWPQIAECDWPKLRDTMANPVVIDGRNLLDPEFMAVAGFTYEGIGRMVETVGGELVEPDSAADDELEAARTRRFTRANGNGNGSVNGAAASTAIAASLMRRQ
ncbi:MAG: UDP-glucose/GDP-mannose dehydrogenase family protein [Thermoleophilia bacterium]